MARDRQQELQIKLEELLGSRNVYYQPPESKKMGYPAIRFSKKRPDSKYANNIIYSSLQCYEITVIDRDPDNPVISELLRMSYSSYDRHYTSDNLNHDVISLYF